MRKSIQRVQKGRDSAQWGKHRREERVGREMKESDPEGWEKRGREREEREMDQPQVLWSEDKLQGCLLSIPLTISLLSN